MPQPVFVVSSDSLLSMRARIGRTGGGVKAGGGGGGTAAAVCQWVGRPHLHGCIEAGAGTLPRFVVAARDINNKVLSAGTTASSHSINSRSSGGGSESSSCGRGEGVGGLGGVNAEKNEPFSPHRYVSSTYPNRSNSSSFPLHHSDVLSQSYLPFFPCLACLSLSLVLACIVNHFRSMVITAVLVRCRSASDLYRTDTRAPSGCLAALRSRRHRDIVAKMGVHAEHSYAVPG